MKKWLRRKQSADSQVDRPTRITNETVAEHRARILAGGRRFKYPIQYARHKLVFNAIIIGVVALVIMAGLGWWQLYSVQNSDTFFYRVTRVLPLPVATIDGEAVRYSHYLTKYRGATHFREREQAASPEDVVRQREYDKLKSMDAAMAEAYAAKLARHHNITLTDEQIDQALERHRRHKTGVVSKESYNQIARDFLGWTPEEYRQEVQRGLLREEVAFAIDDTARGRRDRVAALVRDGKGLEEAAKEVGGDDVTGVQYSKTGSVDATSQDDGQVAVALKLEPGQVSQPFRSTSGDGYIILRLISKGNGKVVYESVRVALREFAKRFDEVKKSTATYYIAMPEEETS